MRISFSRPANSGSTQEARVSERHDARRDTVESVPSQPPVTETGSRAAQSTRRPTVDRLRRWMKCGCISNRVIALETPQHQASEPSRRGSSALAQRVPPQPNQHERTISRVQYLPRTREQSLADLRALREILEGIGAYDGSPVALAANTLQAPYEYRPAEDRVAELRRLRRHLDAAASRGVSRGADRMRADTTRESSLPPLSEETETLDSPSVPRSAFLRNAGHTPWASPAVQRGTVSNMSGQDGRYPSLYPPTPSSQLTQTDGRRTAAGSSAGHSPTSSWRELVERRFRDHFANPRPPESGQGIELSELQPQPPLSSTSADLPSLPSVAPTSSVYSNLQSPQTISPLAYPENSQGVNRTDDNAQLIEEALQQVEPARRDAYRPLIRGILCSRYNLDGTSFFQINLQNSIEVAGEIMARRVLGMAQESTPVERINGWMSWLNQTWNMQQSVQSAESPSHSGSSGRNLEQLRQQRRDQLRAFLRVCDEGNILGFDPSYRRPRTDTQLDDFINSQQFAILVQAIQNVYRQMENATARGNDVEVRYSPVGSYATGLPLT